ncbi:MAG: GerW family sporulation protein [Clostridium sp.]|nr:GerW family sporulation protein [Clostridium sp.]
MADNHFSETVEALFRGMDTFVTSKTVVGNAVRVDHDTVIIPLIDVSCGMAAGAFNKEKKNDGAGGLSAKMSPSALLIIQNGVTKLVSIKHQDAVSKIVDMVPDIVNKFTGKNQVSEDALERANTMAEELAETDLPVEEVAVEKKES